MRGRAALGVLAAAGVVVLAVVAWMALRGGDAPPDAGGRRGEGDTASGASLGGQGTPRTEPEQPARPATAEGIGGRVVDPRGEPVAGAQVFVVPHGVPGVDETALQATTTPSGAFRLPPADLGDTWIGARAPDHGIGYVSGGEAVEGVVIVLPDGLELTVATSTSGELGVQSARVRVRDRSPEGRWAFPGPDALPRVDREADVPVPGALTLRLPTQGAYDVLCLEEDVSWSPRALGVDELPATLRMELASSSRVTVVVEEAATQEPYLGPGVARLFHLESGDELVRIDGPVHAGRYVFRRGLRPDDYYATFEAPEYRPWKSARLEVRENPKRPMVLRVRLIRETDVGDLVLDTPHVSRTAWRPADDAQRAWFGTRPRPRDDGRVVLPALPVGKIHLILWEEVDGVVRTALLEDVEIKGAETTEVGVFWEDGTTVATPAGKKAVWKVAHARLGDLPLTRPDALARPGTYWPASEGGTDLVYGPYPLDEVEAVVVRDLDAEPPR